MNKIIKDGEKIAQDITKIGDNTEKILEATQNSVSKVIKRLVLIGLAAWGAGTIAYEKLKDLPERLNRGQIEKIEDTPGEAQFRVRGAQETHPRKD